MGGCGGQLLLSVMAPFLAQDKQVLERGPPKRPELGLLLSSRLESPGQPPSQPQSLWQCEGVSISSPTHTFQSSLPAWGMEKKGQERARVHPQEAEQREKWKKGSWAVQEGGAGGQAASPVPHSPALTRPRRPCPLCLGNPFELKRADGGQRVMSPGPSPV